MDGFFFTPNTLIYRNHIPAILLKPIANEIENGAEKITKIFFLSWVPFYVDTIRKKKMDFFCLFIVIFISLRSPKQNCSDFDLESRC